MQIQVRINEEGALRNQRFAFTDKFTLISELLQNARRAGARRIEIGYDEASKILRVVDDGCGIEDFQKLLTFNESGWDKGTCVEERPFGIGFSKCLYSASRCIVMSRHRKIDFLTAEALARKPIVVRDIAHHPHTVIELHDVQLPGLKKRMETMCSGFPVAVWFNGEELLRPHAMEQLPFASTEIGHVYLTGTQDGKHSTQTLVFLQGFSVLRPIHFSDEQINIVHLDSKEFTARLPDRDQLIDEGDQRKRIDACLKSLWRQILINAKTNVPAEQFVERYYLALRAWGRLDLLNDVPVLPKALCERIVDYPIQEGCENCDYLEKVQTPLTQPDIAAGNVTLVDLDNVHEGNAAHWMLARAQGYVVFSSSALDSAHWVQAHVRHLEETVLHIAAIGEQCRVTLEGRWIWPEVVLCDTVVLSLGDERVELTEDGVSHGGSLFIPKGEFSGMSVRQASSFIDEHDQFLEDHCDADRDALADLIRRLRCVDPKATLDSLLRELKLEKYPLLRGRTFKLRVDPVSNAHSIELVD